MASTDTNVAPVVQKPNPRNNSTIFKIFQNVQFNVVQHKKYVKEMIKLYKKIEEDVFKESFKNALYYLFTFGDTSANVDRVIQFVATFCTSLDDEEKFLMFIFEIIFDCQCVIGQSVRYRASQLLAAVLSALGDDASLDDDLCDKLLASQMQRLQDTRGGVRCRAALALNRLQNPTEPDDEVTRAYRFHMSCDPSSSVRRAIVMSIAKCTRNVPFVLERLCDVDESVRRAAFLYISAMNVTQLRVRQRVLTLKVGLTERSQRVRRVVEEILIPSWLSAFQGNIIDFLKAICLDNSYDAKDSQYVAEKLLESLFKRLPISELLEWLPTDKTLRLIPGEKLNKETAWYWRHLTEYLQKIDDDETLETVLPDLVVLTGYIRAILESPCPSEASEPVAFSTRQHVLLELARMLRAYDACDPAGRQALRTLITDTLTGDYGPLSAEVIRSLVGALPLVEPDACSRVSIACSVVSALREAPESDDEPLSPPPPTDFTEIKLQRARLRVSLNVAMEAQEEAVRDENYDLAAKCKVKVADIQKKLEDLNTQSIMPPVQQLTTIKEKQCDASNLNKCLIILNAVLDTPQLTTITPMLKVIFSELETEIFQNPDVLDNALETVALFGMLDKEFVMDHKAFFFSHLINSTNESTVCTVLKCIVDLLCVHGAKAFEDDNETENNTKRSTKHSIDAVDADGSTSESELSMSPAHSNVIELLLKLMDTTYPAYRLIIVEGLLRLIYLGHLESPAILGRLILLWFNPATVEEDVLRQTIGIFFQTFPSSVDGAQEQIQKAIIPLLRSLCCAPASSPLSDVDQEAVVRFMVSLTRVSHELLDSQGAMAVVLCGYLVRHPGRAEAALLCRALALLSPPKDALAAAALAAKLRDVCLKLPDKQSCRNLTRYLGALEAVERNSLSKMSNIGDSIQTEDTLNVMGRNTTSLPQPLARSTHVVVNETVEEEPEIDETSPTETVSRISEEDKSQTQKPTSAPESEKEVVTKEDSGADCSGVSPAKKVKVSKGKKKTLSLRKDSDSCKEGKQAKNKKDLKDKVNKKDSEDKGVKRSRSQRSRVDVQRANAGTKTQREQELQESLPPDVPNDLDVSNVTVPRSSTRGLQSGSSSDSTGSKGKQKKDKQLTKTANAGTKTQREQELQESLPPVVPNDLDVSNVTVRRSSTRGLQSGSSSDSTGSKGKQKKDKQLAKTVTRRSSRSSCSRNSAVDETELHTIMYEQHMEQELLDDSIDLIDSRQSSKANVTIPETPDASEESESELEMPTKGKGKRNGK